MKWVNFLFSDKSRAERIILSLVFWLCLALFAYFIFSSNILTLPSGEYFMAGVLLLAFSGYHFIIYSFRTDKKYQKGVLSIIGVLILYQYFTYYAFYLLNYYGSPSPRTSAILHQMGTLKFLEIPINTQVFYHSFTLSLFYLILALSLRTAFELAKSAYLNQKLQEEKLRLELNYLRSQVNPHFLFNMLNSLYKVSLGNEKATYIVLNLQKFLDYSLTENSNSYIPLSRELEFLTSYVELEKLRLDQHKKLVLSIKGNSGDWLIIPLILVNFVENAIKHGLNNTNQFTWAEIQINIEANVLYLHSRNQINQKGKNTIQQNEKGIGLNNALRQLEIYYQNRYNYQQNDREGVYDVHLTIQLHR